MAQEQGTRGFDLTARAVAAQLEAMGAERYEIGISNQATDRMIPRVYTPEQALRAVGFLRAANREDSNIYVRPRAEAGTNVGLVLVDDLSLDRVARMHHDRCAPAAVTETSPGNYQAWVRLTEKPITADLATAAACELMERYGGDPASADYRHYGRLAGYTNRKPTRVRDDGLHPFVRLHESVGRAAGQAEEILEAAAARLRARQGAVCAGHGGAAGRARRALPAPAGRSGRPCRLRRPLRLRPRRGRPRAGRARPCASWQGARPSGGVVSSAGHGHPLPGSSGCAKGRSCAIVYCGAPGTPCSCASEPAVF